MTLDLNRGSDWPRPPVKSDDWPRPPVKSDWARPGFGVSGTVTQTGVGRGPESISISLLSALRVFSMIDPRFGTRIAASQQHKLKSTGI